MNDLISRQAAIDAIYDEFSEVYCNNCDHKSDDGDCCEDCHRKYMNWAASRETVERVLKALPSAQPERPKGKWIWELDEGDPSRSMMLVCSICGSRRNEVGTYNFCNICGAKMINPRGEQDE